MKIFFSHDLMNKDPEKRKKIQSLIIEAGYECSHSCWCKYGATCKYRGNYRFHNACVAISTFFRYRLGWKWFKIPFYFQRHHSDLSGTTKCPHQLPRHKDCWRCIYHRDIRECDNKQRLQMIKEGRRSELACEDRCRCSLFEPVEWFDEYDHKTGDMIY